SFHAGLAIPGTILYYEINGCRVWFLFFSRAPMSVRTRLIAVAVSAFAGWIVADVPTLGQAQAPAPAPPAPNATPRPYFTQPAVPPDRNGLAFAAGGDIWTAALSGGDARLLVSHVATESHPLYSPDGRTLAFVSDRTG